MATAPTRVIIIDLSSRMDTITTTNLSDSLKNVVCLASNLKGPTRIPALGLLVMTSFCECLFPLQPVKGNLQRFNTAIQTLKSIQIVAENVHECINEALIHAINQIKTFEQGISVVGDKWLQFEIVFITTRSLNGFASQVEDEITKMDVGNVKKIQVVAICCLDESGDESSDSPSGGESSFSGVVDRLKLKNDKFQFDNFFKNWLHNHDLDHENVDIVLPGLSESDLVVKCDMFERIVSPGLLPMPEQFLLDAHCLLQNPKSGVCFKGKATENPNRIYHLIATKLVHQSGICDSTLFGSPNILIATTCWKIEWSELETNQQSFTSLCHSLHSKKLVLITKLKPQLPNLPSGHFVIFSSPQCSSLLIKSIAVDELLLPTVEVTSSRDMISKEIRENVEKHLNLLKIEQIYQVPSYSSKLFQSLSSGSVNVKPAKKALFKSGKSPTRRNLVDKLHFNNVN